MCTATLVSDVVHS